MPRTEIFFLDREDQPTDDRVTGTPNVNATVMINGIAVIPAQPAIVDTGADFCVISADERELIRDQVNPADKSRLPHRYLRGEPGDVYEGTVTIHGLGEAVQTYFTVKRHRPRLLIGRHVLEHYRMIYDPLGGVFSLERP